MCVRWCTHCISFWQEPMCTLGSSDNSLWCHLRVFHIATVELSVNQVQINIKKDNINTFGYLKMFSIAYIWFSYVTQYFNCLNEVNVVISKLQRTSDLEKRKIQHERNIKMTKLVEVPFWVLKYFQHISTHIGMAEASEQCVCVGGHWQIFQVDSRSCPPWLSFQN